MYKKILSSFLLMSSMSLSYAQDIKVPSSHVKASTVYENPEWTKLNNYYKKYDIFLNKYKFSLYVNQLNMKNAIKENRKDFDYEVGELLDNIIVDENKIVAFNQRKDINSLPINQINSENFGPLFEEDKDFVNHYLSKKDTLNLYESYIVYQVLDHSEDGELSVFNYDYDQNRLKSFTLLYIEKMIDTGKINEFSPKDKKQLMMYKKKFSQAYELRRLQTKEEN